MKTKMKMKPMSKLPLLPLLASIGALALLAAVATADGPRDGLRANPAPLVTLAGPDSKIAERSYLRIRDREAWVDLWLRHVGMPKEKHSDYYNPARVPEVDFERTEVVAVFQGVSANSAGVFAVEAVDEGPLIRFRFDDRSYQTMDGADTCTAYALFVVPRSEKPIVLEENVQGTIGGEPKWKERARLE